LDPTPVTDNLILELYPARRPGDEPYLVIKSRLVPGQVVVRPAELPALRDALARASGLPGMRPPAARPEEHDPVEDVEITLREAADIFGLNPGELSAAAYRGEIAARQSGLTWLTTRWAIREAFAAGHLRRGE